MQRAIRWILVVMLGSSGLGVAGSSGPRIPGLEDLIEQKGRFETTLIRPDADFSGYEALYAPDLTVRLRGRAERSAPPSMGSMIGERSGSRPALSSEEMELLAGIMSSALRRGLGRSTSFEVVEEPGPRTLIVRAVALDMVSKRASRSSRQSGHGERRLTVGTFLVDVFDSQTGVLLARFAERRKIEQVDDSMASADPANPWPEVGPWVEQGASELVRELEDARGETAAVPGDARS